MKHNLFQNAAAHLKFIHELEPANLDCLSNLIHCFLQLNDLGQLYAAFKKLIQLDDDPRHLKNMAKCLAKCTFESHSTELEIDLIRLMETPGIDMLALVPQCISQLKHKYQIGSPKENFELDIISTDHLLKLVLRTQQINDVFLEMWLIRLREELLGYYTEKKDINIHGELVTAIAIQNQLNEYVQNISIKEQAIIDNLHQTVSSDSDVQLFLIISLYQHPPEIDEATDYDEKHADWYKAWYQVFYLEPLQEKNLAQAIISVTPITDHVSQKVRAMYEKNPYPRWCTIVLDNLLSFKQLMMKNFSLKLDGVLTLPSLPILVAGCGTGKHALQVHSMHTKAKIVAVDISKASLAYAKRKTDELGITTINYHQADILELSLLKQHFAVIECSGVLHHMQSPEAGWAVLRDLLLPGGVMKIGLYSEKARQQINILRQYVKDNKVDTDLQSIREFRYLMINHRLTVRMSQDVLRLKDVWNISGCRDLLFHIQEHQMTIPWIKKQLQILKLEFFGFEFADNKHYIRFKKVFPDTGSESNLDNWHKFEVENPATFMNMYQFWCKTID